MPQVGESAPDFTLPGIVNGERRDYTLSEFRGRKVVLAFYPGDNTPGCTKQLCSYRDAFDDLAALDAVVLGISRQGIDSHEGFAGKHGFAFPLLTDEGQRVAKEYGCNGPLGIKRSVFILDRDGVVRYRHVAALVGVTFKGPEVLAGVLADIP
jgi:peroxiredoxin Q/BCP